MKEYIKRHFLLEHLKTNLAEREKAGIPDDGNTSYNLGYALGYMDAMRDTIEQIKAMPAEEQPKKETAAWHHGV